MAHDQAVVEAGFDARRIRLDGATHQGASSHRLVHDLEEIAGRASLEIEKLRDTTCGVQVRS